MNCSHCHQFNAGGAANIALGFEVPLDRDQDRRASGRSRGRSTSPDARIIAPGDPAGSVLYYRISKLGGGRMPRVGSNQVDERATRLIHDWIKQMKATRGSRRFVAERKAEEEDQAALELAAPGRRRRSPETRAAAIRRLASSTRGGLMLLSLLDQTPATEDFSAGRGDHPEQSPRRGSRPVRAIHSRERADQAAGGYRSIGDRCWR